MISVVPLLLVISIAAPLLLGVFAFTRRKAFEVAVAGSLVALAGVVCNAALYLSSQMRPSQYVLAYYNGLALGFVNDSLSVLVSLMVALNGLATIVFSKHYMSPSNREHPVSLEETPRYYGWLLLFEASALGFVYSSTLLSMVAFFELTSLCSYALISYYEDPESRRSGLQAFIVTHIAALGLYLAAGLTYASTGSVEVVALKGMPEELKTIAELLLLVAAAGKSAQIPFHRWLPDAMVAPTPVSAYLHAAAMVKLGAYLMLRVLVDAGYTHTVALACLAVGVVSMAYGCAMYFPQLDMKRLLAYSTITQLSYIFMGAGLASLGSAMALKGAELHIFTHGFAKELFFLVAGLISFSAGTRMLDKISGLRAARTAAVGFTVAALSVTGVPPFGLFWSKILLILGGYSAGSIVAAIIATAMLCESIVCFAWFLRVFTKCVGGEPSDAVKSMQREPTTMKMTVYFLALMSLLAPFLATPFL
ncbi:hydrogenase 4 subunit D [Thermofilum pendens]|uniref:hydrogenase 4 subunit D n=1 Tax=Thermofilum pendens TaxID=2269 RepID=UPI00069B6E94|nr:hydrogenase 4 subunit D [Thermofilum pendens]